MTTLTPPPDTALESKTPLSEHVERKGYTPASLQTPGCYAIRLCIPDTDSVDAYEHRFSEHYDTIPEYVPGLAAANACYYVGAAANIYERLQDHVDRDVRQAVLPTVFPVHSLQTVWPCASADEAFEQEGQCAIMLRQAEPAAFVHYR